MSFNENTRVKIPAILHLARLGYEYLSLSKSEWDKDTNIFTDIFIESILRINAGLKRLRLAGFCKTFRSRSTMKTWGKRFTTG
jgi:hypothetical protein